MPRRAKLEFLYGPDGADLMEAAPGTGIAENDGAPFHVHFRRNRAVNDETFRIVGRLTDLQEVVANETSVTDDGLAHLRSLSKLSILHLNNTQVTDLGLAHLQSIPLEILDLCNTRVSDAGLERLQDIRSLKKLWIVGCGCTGEAVDRFRCALPACTVIADDKDSGSKTRGQA